MAVDYRVSGLIGDINRRGGLTNSDALFTEQDYIDFLNDAQEQISTEIIKVQNEFFVKSVVHDIVPNQARYPLPVRASGNTLRSLQLVDRNNYNNFAIIPWYDIETLGDYTGFSSSGGSIFGYYFEGNDVVLYPTPTSNQYNVQLRMLYYREPNELVTVDQGSVIQAVDTNTNTITVTNIPNTWIVGDKLDFTQGDQPFDVVLEGVEIISLATNTIVLDGSVDISILKQNDTLALQDFTIIPNLPMRRAHKLLVQAAIVRVLEGLDDLSGSQVAKASYEDQLDYFLQTITPRNDSTPKKVIPSNDIYDAVSVFGWKL